MPGTLSTYYSHHILHLTFYLPIYCAIIPRQVILFQHPLAECMHNLKAICNSFLFQSPSLSNLIHSFLSLLAKLSPSSSGCTLVLYKHLRRSAWVLFLSLGIPPPYCIQHTALWIILQNQYFNYPSLLPVLKNFRQFFIIYQTQISHSRSQKRKKGETY